MPRDNDVPGAGRWPTTLYDELREIARGMMQRERAGHTLEPTAVVHEAWLRLAPRSPETFPDRERFLSYAAQVMRHLLVDHARALATAKRDGGERASLDAVLHVIVSEEQLEPVPVLDVHDALERLAERDA